MSSFEGKVALVTGGTSGIGRATAIAFAEQGAKVVVSGRREEEGSQTVRLIHQLGAEGRFVRGDVSKSADVEAMVRQVEDAYGRLDFAFNNAGVAPPAAPTADQAEEDFDRTVAINLKGVWLSMKYEIPAILRAGGGAIVNNASMGGLIAFAGLGPYHATKHGVLGLTKSAALDYAKTGLRINAVCPGLIATDMLAGLVGGWEQMQKFAAEKQPIGRGGDPEEIASAVIWLCSPGSSLMTGHHLVLDGGMTATA